MKGWFWNKRGSADSRASRSKDSAMTHKNPALNKPEKKEAVSNNVPEKNEEPVLTKKQIRKAKKDSARMLASIKATEKVRKKELDKNKPKEPPDHTTMRLLILVIILTALALFITGLITPILIWKITQNFMIIVGVVFTLFAYILSMNAQMEVNNSPKGADKPYNLGKPALKLSLWATLPMVFLYSTVKTSLVADLLLTQVSTIGLFIAGVCILLSLMFAIKALFVNDKHKGKAILAIILDVILIAAGLLLFI